MTPGWFYVRDRKKVGPVTLAELKRLAGAGRLLPTDRLLREGQSKWVPACDIPALFPPESASTSATPAPVGKRMPATHGHVGRMGARPCRHRRRHVAARRDHRGRRGCRAILLPSVGRPRGSPTTRQSCWRTGTSTEDAEGPTIRSSTAWAPPGTRTHPWPSWTRRAVRPWMPPLASRFAHRLCCAAHLAWGEPPAKVQRAHRPDLSRRSPLAGI